MNAATSETDATQEQRHHGLRSRGLGVQVPLGAQPYLSANTQTQAHIGAGEPADGGDFAPLLPHTASARISWHVGAPRPLFFGVLRRLDSGWWARFAWPLNSTVSVGPSRPGIPVVGVRP